MYSMYDYSTPPRNNRLMKILAGILWAIAVQATGLCLVVVAMIAMWGAAEGDGAEAGGFLLQVAGILAAAAAVLAAVWYALKRMGLAPATRAVVVGALACPGPVTLVLNVYLGQ